MRPRRTPHEAEPTAGLPSATVRSEAVHRPPTRTARAHDVRPATERSAEGGAPADAGGGSRALPSRRASCGTPRARRRRRLVETRRIPEGAPGDSAGPPVPPRREPGELRETVRSVIRRGAGGRARHLGREDEARTILAKFVWGGQFLALNREPLDAYMSAKDSTGVVAAQAEFI